MRLPEPAVGAVDMHGSTVRITGRALQHGFKVMNERANMPAVDRHKSAGSDGPRWIDSGANCIGLIQGLSQQVTAVEHSPFVGIEPVRNSVKFRAKVIAEVQIIFKNQDGLRSVSHRIAQCLQMAHEAATHAGRIKTRWTVGLADLKKC